MGLGKAVSRTSLAAIIVVAIIAFAAGFLTNPAQQVPVTTTIRETQYITSPQTITQTILREQTIVQTQTQVRTIPTTITETATLVGTTVYITTTRTETVKQIETVTRTVTSISTATITQTITQAMGLPQGATPLPFIGKTVFALISTGFNFNGSSNGNLAIYIPAGWGIEITYTNSHTIPHSIALVRNNTVTPQSSNIGSDGTVIASQPEQYSSGISPGSTVKLIQTSVQEGVYWIACGVPGHARAGMWIVLVSSSNVSIPYAITIQTSGSGSENPYSSYSHDVVPLVLMVSLLLIPAATVAILRGRGAL